MTRTSTRCTLLLPSGSNSWSLHVADLVEKQGAAVGNAELAVAALAVGAGVGARGDAEEFGFEQGVGHRRDVDADEGLRRARAGHVDGVRRQLLAGARFTKQQHRAVGLRHALRLPLDFQRRRAAADEARHRVLGAPLRQLRRELRACVVQFALQLRELGDQRLHRRLRVVEQHQPERADHLALPVAQRQPADEKGAGLVSNRLCAASISTASASDGSADGGVAAPGAAARAGRTAGACTVARVGVRGEASNVPCPPHAPGKRAAPLWHHR